MEREYVLDRKILPSNILKILSFLILLALFITTESVFSQEEKITSDKFTYLIENGARMIRENDCGKVFEMISELPPEKKGDFRIKVLENSAYLKSYLLTKNKVHGKKWEFNYKTMLYSEDRTATPILVELLRDDNLYMRAFTAKALGFIGDKRALEELKRVSEEDKILRVRSRAKWAYEQISGVKLPKESLEERVGEMRWGNIGGLK
jgi:HEAT repeats